MAGNNLQDSRLRASQRRRKPEFESRRSDQRPLPNVPRGRHPGYLFEPSMAASAVRPRAGRSMSELRRPLGSRANFIPHQAMLDEVPTRSRPRDRRSPALGTMRAGPREGDIGCNSTRSPRPIRGCDRRPIRSLMPSNTNVVFRARDHRSSLLQTRSKTCWSVRRTQSSS